MCYTLQECLERSGAFRRGKYVYRVLCQNEIKTWDDFVLLPIPSKGLYGNEIMELDKLRKKQIRIQEMRQEAMHTLWIWIRLYASYNETEQITRSLNRADIYSVQLLCSTSYEKLAKISGIGPKRLDILKKVKTSLNSRKKTTPAIGEHAAPSPFQPLLAY